MNARPMNNRQIRTEKEELAQLEIRHEEERRRLRARFDENLERRDVQFRQPINNTPTQYDTNNNIYT